MRSIIWDLGRKRWLFVIDFVAALPCAFRPCHPERQSKSEQSEDQIMQSIIWDLGRKSGYSLWIPLRALPKVGFDYENIAL